MDKAVRLTHVPTYSENDVFAIGLSWMMAGDESGDRFIFHDGHTGTGFNTRCIFYPDLQLGIVIIVTDIGDLGRETEMEGRIREAVKSYENSEKYLQGASKRNVQKLFVGIAKVESSCF